MENKLKDDFYAVLDKAVEYNVSSELILITFTKSRQILP